MRHSIVLWIGPRQFRIGSDWRAPVAALEALYATYPRVCDAIPHFTVRLESTSLLRRWVRPQLAIRGDFTLPDALPVSLAHGLIAAEMAMNLQIALGERRFLLLHASSVERGGRVLIMTGASGSGKSTLSATLSQRGWRFLGDEFALIDPATGLVHPFPRPISLKNASISEMRDSCPLAQFGPVLRGTPKGDLCHMVPDKSAIEAMDVPAPPALILFPRFGHPAGTHNVGQSETFVRLTQASTNYVALGEPGFNALTKLVSTVPAKAIDYPDSETALKLVDSLW